VPPEIFRVTPSADGTGGGDGGTNGGDNLWPEVWHEEVFGPVLCVAEFRAGDHGHGVALANDSAFGLGHAVMTASPSVAADCSRRLRSGMVWVNCSQAVYPSTPFGGCKASGFGREYGEMGLDEFAHAKTVVEAESGHKWNWFG
jgi:betaine-aldehyde dehydrogenase